MRRLLSDLEFKLVQGPSAPLLRGSRNIKENVLCLHQTLLILVAMSEYTCCSRSLRSAGNILTPGTCGDSPGSTESAS